MKTISMAFSIALLGTFLSEEAHAAGEACTALSANCRPGELCNVGAAPGSVGYCVVRPTLCSTDWAPVCGGDGLTYANDCLRLLYGITFNGFGFCPSVPVPSGPPAAPSACGGGCPEGFVCNQTTAPGDQGYCHVRPPVCSAISEPVCGVDGVTYGNDCLRLQRGAVFDHPGPCGSPEQLCRPDIGLTCPVDQVCDHPTDPNAPGRCVARPTSCPDTYAPVCGDTSNTFLNNCYRLQFEASFTKDGPC